METQSGEQHEIYDPVFNEFARLVVEVVRECNIPDEELKKMEEERKRAIAARKNK